MKVKNRHTGERLEFESFSNVTIEHLHRYAIACDLAKGKEVLDIASGEGYGSYLLSKTSKSVVGVDIDIKTVELAKLKYLSANLKFLNGNTSKIPLEDNSIDMVVSFETIEHHDEHHQMIKEISRVLKPNGLLIISSPDKEYYSDLNKTINPFHVKELYCDELVKLISPFFKNYTLMYQNSYNFNSYIFKNVKNLKVFSGDNNFNNSILFTPIYNLILASNSEINSVNDSIYDGEIIRKSQEEVLFNIELEKVYNSRSYKIGNKIVKFLNFFK
jgi:ubiquinone/menaquinone biosynthesis C-methylase UbiE